MSTENTTALKDLVLPVAVKYGTMHIFLFSSKARGDENENIKYDFLISKGKRICTIAQIRKVLFR